MDTPGAPHDNKLNIGPKSRARRVEIRKWRAGMGHPSQVVVDMLCSFTISPSPQKNHPHHHQREEVGTGEKGRWRGEGEVMGEGQDISR